MQHDDWFRPDANPDQWIDQHAAPYRERPTGVLPLQNASDAVVMGETGSDLVEIAILDRSPVLNESSYHLAVRDSGLGMDENEFRTQIGILGVSFKGRQHKSNW